MYYNRNRWKVWAGLLACLLWPALSLRPDVILLRSGERLDGEVVDQNPEEIQLRLPYGIRTIRKGAIKRVIYADMQEEARARDAVQEEQKRVEQSVEEERRQVEAARTAELEKARLAEEQRQQEIQIAEEKRKQEEEQKQEDERRELEATEAAQKIIEQDRLAALVREKEEQEKQETEKRAEEARIKAAAQEAENKVVEQDRRANRKYRMEAIGRSLILPGWGQMYQGRSRAGTTYALSFLALAGADAALGAAYQRARTDYSGAVGLSLFTSSAVAPNLGLTLTDDEYTALSGMHFNNINEQRSRMLAAKQNFANVRAGLAALYAWNLIDVMVFHPRDDFPPDPETPPVTPPQSSKKYLSSALMRSAILPGWGQFYQGRSRAGWTYSVGFLALSGSTASLQNQYFHQREAYSTAVNTSMFTSPFFIESGQAVSDETMGTMLVLNSGALSLSREHMVSTKNKLNFTVSALAGLYVWNLIDIILFEPSATTAVSFFSTPGRWDIRMTAQF